MDSPDCAPVDEKLASQPPSDDVESSDDGEKQELQEDQEEEEETEEAAPVVLVNPLSEGIPPRQAHDKWAVELPLLLVSTNLTLEKFHALKWREIFHLSRLIRAPCFRRVRLAGGDRAIYESCYRSFPHDMVTKPRFVGVLRAVFGVEEEVGFKSKLSPVQVELCRHLEKMQYTYELSSDNVPMVNWRLLLVGLQMFQQPLLSMKEHLAWGFRIFSSAGFLDGLTDATAMKISDVSLMLTQLMRNQACMRLVSERFRQAQVLQPTGVLTPANIRQRMTSSRISHRRFQELLSLSPLKTIFAKVTEHTILLEEMATPLFQQLVFKARKKDSDRKKIERLRFYHRTKRVRLAFHTWYETARVIRRSRQLVLQAFKRIARVQRAFVFAKLKQYAIQSWAATEIQRTVRGMIGRRIAEAKWTLVQAAIRVQGAFRMRSHFVRFLRDLRRRNRAAVKLQRAYRGRLGRIAAKQRLLEVYYREMEEIQKERETFRAVVRGEMAKRLQRCFRALVRRAKEKRRAKDAKERELVELEMVDMASEATRQIRRYKHELTVKYDKLREAFEYKTKRKQIDSVEKNKVIRLRRQRQWEAFKQEKVEIKERHKRESADAYNALQAQWDATIVERTRRKRLFVSQVIALDEPGEWKKLQKKLRALIAAQEKELLTKYKQSQVTVPKSEVRERATIEVIDQQVEEERREAESEWLKAEAAFLNELEAKEEERSLQENAVERQRREKSAVLVQSAFRMFAARKQLKEEIRRCFVKEFDAKTQLAMYRNAYSDDARSARKPFGLGPDEDLGYPDQWVLIDDDIVGLPFFFNPKSMIQSWDKPSECQWCNACAEALKPAIAFAAYWNAQDDSYVCQKCYDSRLAAAQTGELSTFQTDQFFPYDGSKRGGY